MALFVAVRRVLAADFVADPDEQQRIRREYDYVEAAKRLRRWYQERIDAESSYRGQGKP